MENVCIHRIPTDTKMEVMFHPHIPHHIGKAEFNERFFLMRGMQNPK